MDKIAHFVDMSLDDEDRKEMGIGPAANQISNTPKYPYGLCIRLTQHELEKLDVDHGDWSVGDLFHLHALAKVTSVSSQETEGGENKCVELQIIALAGESEDEENQENSNEPEEEERAPEEEEEPAPHSKRRNMYF